MLVTILFVLLTLFGIVLLFFLYLFFAPFYLEINSAEDLYRIRFHRMASARLKTGEGTLLAELNVLGWSKQIDLLAASRDQAKPAGEQASPRKKRKRNAQPFPFRKIRAVLGSFRVNKCRLHIDTGNMQLNGLLYPVFYGLRLYTAKDITIGFTNENILQLELQNSLARMSRAWLSASYKPKTNTNEQLR